MSVLIFSFTLFDHVQDVLAVPDNDDAARHFALAVEVGEAPSDLGAEAYLGHVPQEDRRSRPIVAHRDGLEVLPDS